MIDLQQENLELR